MTHMTNATQWGPQRQLTPGKYHTLQYACMCVVSNPNFTFKRCIQTAKLSFQDHGTDKINWVSHKVCREKRGLLTGNKRRPLSDIQQDYPVIDFTSNIEHAEDVKGDMQGYR
mmetsp:Transcript_18425/g.27318  ORF Transcript_18425/g.27318 Transcript_18425/m.27318 type:complete len:112 (+) Transcript_18425:366-701(+)